jgi:N-acetylmuramoyl-L-alanine amidase
MKVRGLIAAVCLATVGLTTCPIPERTPVVPGRTVTRIVVGGERIPIRARVVLWDDAGGFNAYLETCFFKRSRVLPSTPAAGCNTPRRYGVRDFLISDGNAMSSATIGRSIREHIDQVVIHYDAAGSSRRCFDVLHDNRGLSSHFLIDMDGTIYQTLDVVERARHAGQANDRSIGIEIANVGAYSSDKELKSHRRGARSAPVVGRVQNRRLHQYRFTDAQYDALIELIAALRSALPRIRLDVPRSSSGQYVDTVLSQAELQRFRGILGHYHVSDHKVDPGPAFEWDRLVNGLSDR